MGYKRAAWRERVDALRVWIREGGIGGGGGMDGGIVLFCCCDKNRHQEQLMVEILFGFMVPGLCWAGFRGWCDRPAIAAPCIMAVSAPTLTALTLRQTALNIRYGVEDQDVGYCTEKGWEGRPILTTSLPDGSPGSWAVSVSFLAAVIKYPDRAIFKKKY